MDFIKEKCEKYKIRNYSIRQNGEVDVRGDVDLTSRNLHKLPIVFNHVTGIFNCSNNRLTTLMGSPKYVGHDFICSLNELPNLVGAPEYIGGNFICSHNLKLNSTYSGNNDIDVKGFMRNINFNCRLPHEIMKYKQYHTQILKYQRYFDIWNVDLSLNEENFKLLITECSDGLL